MNVRVMLSAVLLAGLLTGLHTPAWAEARPGWSLFLNSGRFFVQDTTDNSQYRGDSLGAGLDRQFALGSHFSLLLFVNEVKQELTLPSRPEDRYLVADVLGLEARLWLGPLYVGAYRARYYLSTAQSATSVRLGASGPGYGFTAGLEGGSGWYAGARGFWAQGLQMREGPHVDLSGTLIAVGYRWR